MKNISKSRIFWSILAVVIAVSCSGNIDPEAGGDNTSKDPLQPFTLSVDKSSIESNGTDAATLTIKDANGLVLTGKDYIKNTSFYIKETDQYQSGMTSSAPNVFTSISDGTYTVSAMYNGKYCANEINITSANRKKYEVFHKNVAIYRLTRTWCQYCPTMTDELNKINKSSKEHSIVLEFHNVDEFAITNSGKDIAGVLLGRFAKSGDEAGLPFCIYSLDNGTGDKTVMEIQEHIKKQLYDNPARTGIKATSTASDGSITVNATVKASVAGKYDLVMAILEDNCKPTSGEAYESVYNDVVRSISGNYYAMASDSAFNLQADGEKEIVKSFNFDSALLKMQNIRIVLMTLREAGNKVLIDNAIEFKVGENLDYKYN